MSGTFDDKNRQVIPRWLDFKTACNMGFFSDKTKKAIEEVKLRHDHLPDLDWVTHPNITTAVEFLSSHLVVGAFASEDAQNAARFILKNSLKESLLVRNLAQTFLDMGGDAKQPIHLNMTDTQARIEIAQGRKLLRENPANPIAWSDLSLLYAMAGLHTKARKAMIVALSLGPQNRFILRNASRCFLHLGEADHAVYILRHSGLCDSDPWIAAAEVAMAESVGKKSSCLDQARFMVADNNLSPLSCSELAAALSTIESKSGAHKKANVLIRQAMLHPTENALAQAEWLATERHTDVPKEISLLASFEAQARHFYRSKQYATSLTAARKWVAFQPFSSRPIILASYLSSVCLGDDMRTIEIMNQVPLANRNNPLLINNLAFAYARQNQVAEAINELKKINPVELNNRELLIINATKGLVLFRLGKPEEGRINYLNTVHGFDKLNDAKAAAAASFFWACEEKRIASVDALQRIDDAKKRIKRAGVCDLEDAASKL